MAKLYTDTLSYTFGALTDPTRRAILSFLQTHPGCSVSDLAAQLPLKIPGITKHLAVQLPLKLPGITKPLDVLSRAKLVERKKKGRVVSLKLRVAPLHRAGAWLAKYDAFWTGSLDKLQRRLERGE